MIAQLVRQYIAGPIARLAGRIRFEPVVVAGLFLQGITFFRDQLDSGVDLETALTASIIALGTYLVRQNVWPDARVQGMEIDEPLGRPITGIDILDFSD